MALISAYVDQVDLGSGLLQNTINMKPVAYLANGAYRAMNPSWTDSGDSARQQIVTAAPLMVSAGNDGLRRFHPTRQIDKYIELGAPYVQVGGVWTQVNLGTPTRTGKTLTWQTANADFTVQMGGHFCDLDIELKNGYVPQNSRVAFPVGISGLTRSGTAILDGGNVVANLRPFQMYDAANPLDRRDITHTFTALNGQPYLLLTLPSLTGMSRPVIDPTLSLQPDATTGIDTLIYASALTANYGAHVTLETGDDGNTKLRAMLSFDLSSIPASANLSSSTLTLYCVSEAATNDYTVDVNRALTQWYEGAKDGTAPNAGQDGSTWNLRNANGSIAWAGGVGGAAGSDWTTTPTASTSITAPSTAFTWNVNADCAAFISGSAANYGWWLHNQSYATFNSSKRFASSDNATAANRPKLVVAYTLPSLGRSFFVAPFQAPFASGVFG